MIAFFKPWVGAAEHEALRRPLQRGWLTQGPEVEAFETEFAAYVGAKHAVAVSNGTTALHSMLVALGVGPGDEVVVPSHSFIATSNAVRYVGADIVFVDIEPATLNLDAAAVQRALSAKTKAVLAVHQFGMPCDMNALSEICRDAEVMLLEDAACAIGSELRSPSGEWERIGKPHGLAATFSFHPRKLLATGEGGMVVTADDELARKLRRLRQHGMEVGAKPGGGAGGPVFVELGYNYRMSDLLAAVGRAQLSRLNPMLEHRRQQVGIYKRAFGDAFQEQPGWARGNRQTLAMHVGSGDAPRIVAEAHRHGVALGSGIVNSHQTPAYRDSPWSCVGAQGGAELVSSERATNSTILLPLYPDLSEDEQQQVIRVVKGALFQIAS